LATFPFSKKDTEIDAVQTTYDIENVNIGNCEIWYGGEHLGHTYGGCNLRIISLIAEKKEDATGDIVVEFIELGCNVEVSCYLAEETISKIAGVFPTATEVGSFLTFGKDYIGDELDSKRLLLKSVDGYYITVYKAVANPGEQVEITYGTGKQRIYSIVFKGVPDIDRPEGEDLFDITVVSSSSSQSSSSSSSSSESSSSSSESSESSRSSDAAPVSFTVWADGTEWDTNALWY